MCQRECSMQHTAMSKFIYREILKTNFQMNCTKTVCSKLAERFHFSIAYFLI